MKNNYVGNFVFFADYFHKNSGHLNILLAQKFYDIEQSYN